ncbi:ATP-binding cassette domain-containing protein [Paenibacillus sp. GCM10012306]|uniref:ATP-binding cassette domain-containing protein n=1 Tax=Paenibacillus sp. GCM10012306 TaxID=3317342 RepID=UPI00361FC24C
MLVFDQVDYYYRRGNPVLQDVSFEIHPGEFVAIVGGNGSGKSTLAKLINGLLQPRKGQVRLNQLNTLDNVDLKMIREQVGLVFQNPEDQFITTTVLDEIVFGLENLRIAREEMLPRVHGALQAVRMEEYLDAMPHQLSGGEKQRVAIAAILAMRPSVLVFDEATSMLDPQERKDILEVMRTVHRSGMTIIHITHHMDEILSADRVLHLSNGVIHFDGTPSAFFNNLSLTDQLPPPFVVRLHRTLGLNAPLCSEWKETITTLWSMN